MTARLALALLLCSMGAACDGGSGQACKVDDDCASGFCKVDGTCGEAETDAGTGDGDANIDASNVVCTPNHDGVITLSELPFAPGRMGTFRIATDATWNTAGTAMPMNQRRWDLSGALANDQDRDLALVAPASAWWAPTFPSATYATPLTSESELRGVFELGSDHLDLVGVVSPDSGTYKTELEYDAPARVLAIPLQAGTTWTTTSTVSGYAQGVYAAYWYTDVYESHVDQVGTMVTPYGEFPVLRIATDLTRTSGFTPVTASRTFTWVAECFGPVATATSQANESSNEFSDIAEVRRLAP